MPPYDTKKIRLVERILGVDFLTLNLPPSYPVSVQVVHKSWFLCQQEPTRCHWGVTLCFDSIVIYHKTIRGPLVERVEATEMRLDTPAHAPLLDAYETETPPVAQKQRVS